jgi:Bacterial alpha-L-rhamnosidase 6 hairpin glycosidase domain/Bacterial alpha-L-rhamnosidase C-terminal domain
MIAPGPLTTDAEGRPCPIALATVLLDGYVRDRCPYVGDQAVTGMTLLVSTPSADSLLRNMILWYADNQRADGSIPASPDKNGTLTLFDYEAYWVEDVYDYVLYTGDISLAQQVWPNLVKLMDTWYPGQMGPDGLLVNSLGDSDYAYIQRTGTTVAYYNAGYVRALRFAAQLANWVGQPSVGAGWTARIAPIAAAFGPAFWDPSVGAFKDATVGAVVHPEDGNVFAVLAGLATPKQAVSALDYLGGHEWQYYGATLADNDVWDGYPWGDDADLRVYPFIGYFDVVARYQYDLDHSALALIRREWGYMLKNGPQSTMWETIGPYGGPPVDQDPSYDHGWSSGAAPALTSYALGVQPATPGFGTFVAEPHPADLKWARGTVPTPHGPITFKWYQAPHGFSASVSSPVPGKLILPDYGVAKLDGKKLPQQWGLTVVSVPSGTHEVVITSASAS